jgi:hypothetical protein
VPSRLGEECGEMAKAYQPEDLVQRLFIMTIAGVGLIVVAVGVLIYL